MAEPYSNRKRPRMMSLSKKDIDGRWYVEVEIDPDTLQDKVALSQVAAAMRQPGGPDHRPLMADIDIYSQIFKEAHPERRARNVDLQMIAASNQEVMQLKIAAAVKEWKKANPEIVRLAEAPEPGEKRLSLTPEELDVMAQLKAMQQQGLDVPGMLGQMMAGQGGYQMPPNAMPPGGQPPPMGGQPQTGGLTPQIGGGLAQAALPEQFTAQPADMIPEPGPAGTAARQTRRGKPQNNPKKPGRRQY